MPQDQEVTLMEKHCGIDKKQLKNWYTEIMREDEYRSQCSRYSSNRESLLQGELEGGGVAIPGVVPGLMVQMPGSSVQMPGSSARGAEGGMDNHHSNCKLCMYTIIKLSSYIVSHQIANRNW